MVTSMGRARLVAGDKMDGAVPVIFMVAVVLASTFNVVDAKSRIVFQNGVYDNITVAVDKNFSAVKCADLINAVKTTLSATSNELFDATDGKGRFGKVRILIPQEWTTDCSQEVKTAETHESYETADVKITTEHPIAIKLPWAEQSKGCGKSADAIYVPPSFFTESEYASDRERIFLHEWLKFRYGVFEEFGFLGDKYFFPCYKKNAGVHFTSCTSPILDELSRQSSISPNECRNLMIQKNDTVTSQLKATTSSLLFGPHVDSLQIPKLCTNASHNSLANTKQNFQCYRKSAFQVISSHPDFADVTDRQNSQAVDPTFELFQLKDLPQGYAFIVEDTSQTRVKDYLRLVKQAIAEFLYFVDERSSSMARLMYFGDRGGEHAITISTSKDKANFLSYFGDTTQQPGGHPTKTLTSDVVSRLLELISLDDNKFPRKWDLVLISSSPPSDMQESMNLLRATGHRISIVTFDQSAEWLTWNFLTQTKRLLYVPSCTANLACSARIPSLMTDHLLEILADQQPRRFFQKVLDVEVNGSQLHEYFSLRAVERVTNWMLTFHVFSGNPSGTVFTPSGATCAMDALLGYSQVLQVNQTCNSEYLDGSWMLEMKNKESDATYVLRGYVETDDGILVRSSFGNVLSKMIFPSLQNFMVPLHVTVKTSSDKPIISAQVEAEITHDNGNGTSLIKTIMNLKDDGAGADVTKYDGIYSGYVHGFSPNPTFHSGRITAQTSRESRIVSGLEPGVNEPALFENRMNTKCCGSTVPAKTSELSSAFGPVGAVISSFRTGEIIIDPAMSSPMRIDAIEVADESDNHIDLQFIAPASDLTNSTVNHYEICLACDDCLCKSIPISECPPVDPGFEQVCLLRKDLFREAFVDPTTAEEKAGDYVTFICGLRAVNKWDLRSPISFSVFEVSVYIEGIGNSTSPTCLFISDGCLPLYIFWILIGCVAGLLILLLVTIFLCWFCNRRKQRESKDVRATNRRTSDSGLDSLRTSTFVVNRKEPDATVTSRAIYSDCINDMELQPKSTHQKVIPVHSREINERSNGTSMEPSGRFEEVPSFVVTAVPRQQKSRPPVPKKPQHYSNTIAGYGLRGHQNNYSEDHRSMVTLPTVSSTVDASNPPRQYVSQVPLYATVNRNRRRPDRLSGAQVFPAPIPSHVNGNVPVRLDQHHSTTQQIQTRGRPQSSQSLDSGFVRSQSQLGSPPLIRMDHFPSSESETYSEMSRVIPAPPPPPPPLPSPGDLSGRHLRRAQEPEDERPRSQQREVPHQMFSPPQENAFSILAKMGPIPDRRSVLKPRSDVPPPPPPRKTSERNPDGNHAVTVNTYGSRRHDNDSDRDLSNEDDGDDSDNWDVYDDFDFSPGVSHV